MWRANRLQDELQFNPAVSSYCQEVESMKIVNIRLATIVSFLLLCMTALAQAVIPEGESSEETETGMTAERLGELVLNVDEDARFSGSGWEFHVAELEVGLIYDVRADRMRIIIPIGPIDDISEDELLRIMQANFDSALDARYAIAQGKLWGTFIHPLSELSDEEFLIALGETANIVLSYGTSYSSGMFIFGGGDSVEIQHRELIESLRKKST